MATTTKGIGLRATRAFGQVLALQQVNPGYQSIKLTGELALRVPGTSSRQLTLSRNNRGWGTRPLVRLIDTYRIADMDIANTRIRLTNTVRPANYVSASLRTIWDIARNSNENALRFVQALVTLNNENIPLPKKTELTEEICDVAFFRGTIDDYFGHDISRVTSGNALLNMAYVGSFGAFRNFATEINNLSSLIAQKQSASLSNGYTFRP
ncbi:MAG TPA: hypothetical protein VII56_01385 [Rhizomicrobium sp.]